MDVAIADAAPVIYWLFTIDQWINVVIAIGTVAAAVGAIIYMHQQSGIFAKQNEILDEQTKCQLFTLRYEIYEGMLEFLCVFIQNFEIDTPATKEFNILRARAAFLYDDDVNLYLKEIYERGVDIHFQNNEIKQLIEKARQGLLNAEQEKKRLAVNQRNHDEIIWFSGQIEAAKLKFKDYIDLARIK